MTKRAEGISLTDRILLLLVGASALAIASGLGGAVQAAPKLKVLFSFNYSQGSQPQSALLADGAGNLYGTTTTGGANGKGAVFELSPPVGGHIGWTETVLHSFDGSDGLVPFAGLIADGAGNLYGTAAFGGANNDGVVFELSSPAPGKTAWTETVLSTFNGADGINPEGLVADGSGNLYGTTPFGGENNCGVLFELSPPRAGQSTWTQATLFNFSSSSGAHPHGDLIFDGAGNLYGTTENGGDTRRNYGVVFELSPPAAGQAAWSETVLHFFHRDDGDNPTAGLLIDSAGDLYGTTSKGGTNKDGVVFELSPPAPGEKRWAETVLLMFDGKNGAGQNPDPAGPSGGLLADGVGNLRGTTSGGGAYNQGEVFELRRPQTGHKHWIERILYSFKDKHGSGPSASLIADAAGNLYGTTFTGGADGFDGVVFKYHP